MVKSYLVGKSVVSLLDKKICFKSIYVFYLIQTPTGPIFFCQCICKSNYKKTQYSKGYQRLGFSQKPLVPRAGIHNPRTSPRTKNFAKSKQNNTDCQKSKLDFQPFPSNSVLYFGWWGFSCSGDVFLSRSRQVSSEGDGTLSRSMLEFLLDSEFIFKVMSIKAGNSYIKTKILSNILKHIRCRFYDLKCKFYH